MTAGSRASSGTSSRRFRHRYVYLPIVFALLVALNLAVTALIQG